MQVHTVNFNDRIPQFRVYKEMREWVEAKAVKAGCKPPDILRSLIKNEMDKEKK